MTKQFIMTILELLKQLLDVINLIVDLLNKG